tara:strand:- start:2410 stop:2790 length:381 start_codon:yes stop_codon:yes gene_type:complete
VTASERLALAYMGSLVAAGVWNYRKGSRGQELVGATVVQGAFIGTGVSVVVWLSSQTDASQARANIGGCKAESGGKLSTEAIKLLASVNKDKVYEAFKNAAVKIGPVYESEKTVGTFDSGIPSETP